MATIKKIMILLLVICAPLLSGCGKKIPSPAPSTPQEVMICTMECIKKLDMETLNKYTDNYIQTYYNWIGIPVENEYRVFNELLQPRSKRSKRYQSAYKLDQKMMEHLTWEITDVRESDDTAEIDMAITNINMLKVMENYESSILENMLENPGLGISQLIKDMAELVTVKETLISIIEELDDSDINTINVTVSAYQENGQWKIHLSHDFINAFSGNMYADHSESMDQRITKLGAQVENKAEEWAEQFAEKAGKWAEQFE